MSFSGPNPTGQTTGFSSAIPQTTEGYAQLFSGTYNGGKNNLVNIDRTWTADMCGFDYNVGPLLLVVFFRLLCRIKNV